MSAIQALAELAELLPSATGAAGCQRVLALLVPAIEQMLPSEGDGPGRVLRAMLHLRTSHDYRALEVLETGAVDDSAVDVAASATVWRWVVQAQASVSVDVVLGTVDVHDGRDTHAPGPDGALHFDGRASQDRLLARATTHVHATPLFGGGDAPAGMLCVEVGCRAAIGRPIVERTAGDLLRIAARLVGPRLHDLEVRDEASVAADPLLPVIGRQLRRRMPLLRVFARQSELILICGPTGAGKSRLSAWCHAQSDRADAPFEVVDLSASPATTRLAELFGWRRGAFTGAVAENPGALGRARGGTLFIDEIDTLPLDAQAALLRLLETGRFRPLGDRGPERQADVRFIVGTNQDLSARVSDGRFREDLYYRINVLPIRLPGLSERSDEIDGWAGYMAARCGAASNPARSVSMHPGASALLARQPWPGNLRQLDNVIRRAFAFALADAPGGARRTAAIDEAGDPTALGADVEGPVSTPSTRRPRLVLDPRHIRAALDLEHAPPSSSDDGDLQAAARHVAHAAAQRSRTGEDPLPFEALAGFAGLCLVAAAELLGSRADAFRAFGRARLVETRNHQRIWRREVERAEALLARLRAGDRPR